MTVSRIDFSRDEKEIIREILYPDEAELSSISMINHPEPALSPSIRDFIRSVCGRDSLTGQDKVRIVWGPKRFRQAYGGQWIMKYEVQREWINGERYDIGLPRWIIEDLVPAWLMAPDYNEWLQGPFPSRGEYQHFMTVQNSDGSYAYPDQRFLDELQRQWHYRMNKRQFQGPDEMPHPYESEEGLKELHYTERMRKETQSAKDRDLIERGYRDWMRRITHKHPNEGKRPDPYIESKKLHMNLDTNPSTGRRIITV